MKKLLKIIQLGGFLFVLLVLGSLFNPSPVSAQACTGIFYCCESLDAYGNCVGIAGSFSCGQYNNTSFSQCTDVGPDRFCEREYGASLLFNGCSWYSPLPTPTPTDTPPNGTPPPPSPTETPPPPPVSGNARPRYQFSQLYPFPCNKIAPEDSEFNDFEFHSLRPYQASPCNPNFEDLALFCGNDLIISDPRTVTKIFVPRIIPIPRYEGSYEYEGEPIGPACFTDDDCESSASCIDGRCVPANCRDNGDGTENCWFNIERVRSVAIDLEGAFLPIMGFTEPSVGSFDRPDRVDNAYDQDETMTDAEKVNEYVSWYLHSIIGRAEYDPPDPDTIEGRSRIIDFSGPLKRLLAFDSQEDIRRDEIGDAGSVRHDQVVVCTNLLGQATECYPPRLGVTQRRMTNVPDRHLEYVPFSSTEDRLGKSQIATYSIQPALSSTFIILSTAILEQTPAILYFPHMQEGSELAKILQGIFAYQGANLEAEPEDWVASTSDFCDLRAIRSNPGDNLFAGEITATIQYNAMLSCTFIEEGSGIAGDPYNGNLCRFFTGADCIPDVPRNYECAENYGRFDCDPGFDCARDCKPLQNTCIAVSAEAWCVPGNFSCVVDVPGVCPSGYSCGLGCTRDLDSLPSPLKQECTVGVLIALRTTSETPLAEDVWKRLVANPVSVFRRIFPQIEDEEGRPITRLFDMPAATSVIYSGEGVTVAGNPASGRPANQAELYFPHIGGVHEYFLKCIQKTLRPEGFGEGCISGPEPLVGLGSGDCTPVGGTTFTGTCNPGVGPCSPGNLEGFFRSAGCSNPGQKALEASKICNLESGSNPLATNCSCLTGGTCDYSIGLFQINLLAHCAASAGFDFNCALKQCTITDQSLVDSCAQKYYDANENIRYMIQISGCGTNWTPWTKAAITCGLL